MPIPRPEVCEGKLKKRQEVEEDVSVSCSGSVGDVHGVFLFGGWWMMIIDVFDG